MKKILFLPAFALASIIGTAQSLNTPQPSPTQTMKQNFSTGYIELSYSRPGVKGRKIFGDLVPYGKIWRTGANGATTLNFSDDVIIGGKELKAGKYGLLTIPGETEWTVIITKDTEVTSPADYKQENDAVRVTTPVLKVSDKVESFTMQFINLTGSTCDLRIMWENTAIVVPIKTDTEGRVMKQIDEVINKDNKPYFSAASYYYDNGKDLNKAKEWVEKGIEGNPTAFWMQMLKARILAKQGDKAGAKAAAEKTIELATAAKPKNDDYIKLANDLIKTL